MLESNTPFNLKKMDMSVGYEHFEMLYDIVELIPNPIYYKNEDGIYIYCNDAFSRYLGLKKEEIIGHTVYEINPYELACQYREQDEEIVREKGKKAFKSKVRYNDETYRDVLLNKVANLDADGRVKGTIASMTDITELINYQKRMDKLLLLNKAMLDINRLIIEKNDIIEICNYVLEKVTTAMEKADIGCVMVLDDNDRLKIIASIGYDKEQCKKFSICLQESFHYLQTNGNIDEPIIINDVQKFDWKSYDDYWKRSKANDRKPVVIDESESVDWNLYSKKLESAEKIKLQSTISMPIFFNGKLFGFIDIDSTQNNAFDESDLEVMKYVKYQIEVGISKYKLYEQTVYLSRYDKLTNLYNRGYFEELFHNIINRAAGKPCSFSLVIFDLNGLKSINDSYGHLAGDEFIKRFAYQLNNVPSCGDFVSRLGGDEFAAVIFDMEYYELEDKLEKINTAFKGKPIVFENNTIMGSFSYGIARYPDDGVNYNSLFKKADKNMYEYKQKIKNK